MVSISEIPARRREMPGRLAVLGRVGQNRPAGAGLLVLGLLIALALAAPLLATVDPNAMDTGAILQSPSWEHPFGTDDFGRDIFSRVLHGIRISLLVGVTVATATGVLGVTIGALAGYYSRVDNIVMRVMDIFMALPAILLAIGVMAILGPNLMNIIIALIIPYAPRSARVVRAEVLMLREQEFIIAARSLGMSDLRILARHLIPNSLAPLLIQQTYILALSILAESGLNFLGVGVPPEVPTLGGILSDSRTYLQTAPWMSLFPGLTIALLVLGVNLLGDGMRDVLDPRMRR